MEILAHLCLTLNHLHFFTTLILLVAANAVVAADVRGRSCFVQSEPLFGLLFASDG